MSDLTAKMHKEGIKPCLRCGSLELIGYDWGDDLGCEIECEECGAIHTGAFGEDTLASWNKASSVSDLNVSHHGKQPEDRRFK